MTFESSYLFTYSPVEAASWTRGPVTYQVRLPCQSTSFSGQTSNFGRTSSLPTRNSSELLRYATTTLPKPGFEGLFAGFTAIPYLGFVYYHMGPGERSPYHRSRVRVHWYCTVPYRDCSLTINQG